jgi:YVTN family beta-propeller protein
MKFRRQLLRVVPGITAFALACLLGSAQSLAQNAYITNQGSNNVTVINTATNTVVTTIPVGNDPAGVTVTADGKTVYVANLNDNSLSVIDVPTLKVTGTITVGPGAATRRTILTT